MRSTMPLVAAPSPKLDASSVGYTSVAPMQASRTSRSICPIATLSKVPRGDPDPTVRRFTSYRRGRDDDDCGPRFRSGRSLARRAWYHVTLGWRSLLAGERAMQFSSAVARESVPPGSESSGTRIGLIDRAAVMQYYVRRPSRYAPRTWS